MPVPVSALTAAACALLLVALSLRISFLRMTLKVSLGDAGQPALLRAVRAHANAAEHVPIFVLLALAYELTRGSDAVVIATTGTFVAARLLHAAGMLGRGLHLARMAGAVLTNLAQAALAVALPWALLGTR
ncbi:MAG TPA: MAPEG family protein [Candidatus Binatia bacterium]|nr:MAPEG family protein [Candidatus Binatia bacterium]